MTREIRNHIIGWIIYIGYESSLLAFSGATKSPIFNYLAYYIVYILLFYSFYILLRIVEGHKFYVLKLITGTLFILLCYHLARGIIYNLLLKAGNRQGYWNYLRETNFGVYTARATLFMGLSFATWKATFAYKKVKENASLREEQLELESELTLAEIKYLKAQINPHFIYNTLNYLYYGLEKKDEQRARALLLLSDVLRYNITDIPPSGFVPLKGEVKNIFDLLKLAKLRFEGHCYFTAKVTGKINGYVIIPMILGTLVENVFKHGDIYDPKIPAEIYITIDDGNLVFITRNKIKNAKTRDDRPNTGIEFARRRLTMYYKDHFSLDVGVRNSIFETELKIFLL
ncbi:sensor histidine kinase [Rhizosphaericola mali]|nr:histidine kinase [Rhizosphaericola mali]